MDKNLEACVDKTKKMLTRLGYRSSCRHLFRDIDTVNSMMMTDFVSKYNARKLGFHSDLAIVSIERKRRYEGKRFPNSYCQTSYLVSEDKCLPVGYSTHVDQGIYFLYKTLSLVDTFGIIGIVDYPTRVKVLPKGYTLEDNILSHDTYGSIDITDKGLVIPRISVERIAVKGYY